MAFILKFPMPKYRVGKQWFFPELGRKPDAGEVIELSEESAERYMHNEPGLLTPERLTTQAKPTAVRTKRTRATKVRVRRVK